MSLTQILQDSAYRLTQFKPARITALEACITWKQTEKASTPYVIEQDEAAGMEYLAREYAINN